MYDMPKRRRGDVREKLHVFSCQALDEGEDISTLRSTDPRRRGEDDYYVED
jgi:hypothetical protein